MAFRALSQRLGPAAARCLATETKAAAAAAVAEPTLPLKLHGLPGRYASALYVAAAKAKALPEVEKELAAVIDMAAGNDKFADFLADPSASKSVKTKGIGSIMEAGKFSATTKQFFAVLAENGRLGETHVIAERFEELMMASRGEVKAVVTSAEPLTAAELSSAKAALEKLLAKGQSLNMKTAVNPDIIGGLVFSIGDKHIDLSLNKRIREVENLLSQRLA